MLLWIQQNPLRSGLYLSLAGFLLFGGVDLMFYGPTSLLVASALAAAIGLFQVNGWLAVGLNAVAMVLTLALPISPGMSGLLALVTTLLMAALSDFAQRISQFIVSAVSGFAVVVALVIADRFSEFEFLQESSSNRLLVALFGFGLVASSTSLAYLAGRWLMTLTSHIGTPLDRLVVARERSKIQAELADQRARFTAARDISELVVQRLTAAISIADGATFMVKGHSEVAERALGQVASSARAAHMELRRLYDMLNRGNRISAAPPGLDDLPRLATLYRELGYNLAINHVGNRVTLDEGLELSIYRIVFEALENVREHVPVGADVTVDFSWTEQGLQVLIKDNGVEFVNRAAGLLNQGYTADADRKALVEEISGTSVNAMRERAAMYGGSIEATRVPGVGFTISAIFPGYGN